MKEYTPLRRFYAIVGFIHLLFYFCYGVYTIAKPNQEPQQQPEPVQIIEVTNETPAETEEEYIPVSYNPQSNPVSTPAFVAPEVVEEPIVPTSNVSTLDVGTIVIDTDIEWKPLCLALVELVGTPREEYGKQAMSSYRSCAGTFITIAQRMANSGLMGIVFADTFVQLSTEYQLLSV